MRVARLRESLTKRSDAKQQIIERRLNDLFSDIDGLGWGDVDAEVKAKETSKTKGGLDPSVRQLFYGNEWPIPQSHKPDHSEGKEKQGK